MDVLEVLGVTVDVLRGIQIPVELAEQVGRPVLGAIGNLRLCMNALSQQKTPPEGDESQAADGAEVTVSSDG